MHNEVGHIQEEIQRIRAGLDASHYSYELIVVDDGSTDGSIETLAASPGLRIVRMDENRGAGAARRLGTEVARGRIVVWTDVDLTYPNHAMADLVKELEGFDQVVGARSKEKGTVKVLRGPAKWFIRRLAMILTDSNIPDLNSGFRAFRRDVGQQFLHLLPNGFSCVTTITLAFLANGYTVRYVPIEYASRAGRSKFHWWGDTRRYLVQVVRMALMFNPLRVVGPLGALMLLGGVAKLAYDVITDPLTVSINTVLLLGAAIGVLLIAFVSDLVVQLTRPAQRVLPAAALDASGDDRAV